MSWSNEKSKELDVESNKPLWNAIQTLENRITQLEQALRGSAKDWTWIHNELGLCIEAHQQDIKELKKKVEKK